MVEGAQSRPPSVWFPKLTPLRGQLTRSPVPHVTAAMLQLKPPGCRENNTWYKAKFHSPTESLSHPCPGTHHSLHGIALPAAVPQGCGAEPQMSFLALLPSSCSSARCRHAQPHRGLLGTAFAPVLRSRGTLPTARGGPIGHRLGM